MGCREKKDSPARGKSFNFAGRFKIHLLIPCQNKKWFKTQGTRKSCLPTKCTGKWWSQQFIFPEQLIFCCINTTSAYPTVWKHSRIPFCIQPLLGTRYHCSLSGSCVMLRRPWENWDVELLSRNLIQTSFTAVEIHLQLQSAEAAQPKTWYNNVITPGFIQMYDESL